MQKLLLAVIILGGLASGPVYAVDAVNNLSIITIPDPDVVPQSLSRPCLICATTQAHNPVGFGYNNFDSQGNDSSFNLFSSNITGSFANNDQTTVTPYLGGQLRDFLLNAGFQLSFAVAVDINSTGANSEHLDFFQLINVGQPGLGDETVLFDLRNVDLPAIHNGNGAADYLITGFDLSSVQVGDRLLFRAQWSGAVDGGESFYIVPRLVAIPGPIAGAGIPGLIAALIGMFGLQRYRRRRNSLA